MYKVGLTGGIGSGKSSACQQFAHWGVPIIDTDQIAHQLLAPGQALLDQLCQEFGTTILNEQGELNRPAMRQQVFNDPAKLARLEQHMHPAIRAEMTRQLAELQAPYVILAIPLLVEKGWQSVVDRVLVVDCSESLQLTRATHRDGADQASIRRIMAQQASRQQRLAVADDILHNEGSIEALASQVAMLHQQYLQLAQRYQSTHARPDHLRTPP